MCTHKYTIDQNRIGDKKANAQRPIPTAKLMIFLASVPGAFSLLSWFCRNRTGSPRRYRTVGIKIKGTEMTGSSDQFEARYLATNPTCAEAKDILISGLATSAHHSHLAYRSTFHIATHWNCPAIKIWYLPQTDRAGQLRYSYLFWPESCHSSTHQRRMHHYGSFLGSIRSNISSFFE